MSIHRNNMENMIASYWRILVYISIMVTANSNAQEDILRNTLLSINHRPRDAPEAELYNPNFYLQSDLPTYYRRDAIQNYVQPESDERSANEVPYTTIDYAERLIPDVEIDKILFDYLDENNNNNDNNNNNNNRELKNEGMNKRMLSSFRERMESQKDKEQHDKLTEMFLQKLQENSEDDIHHGDNTEYMNMIDNLWQKYNKHQQQHFDEPIHKRQIPGGADYSTLGWSGVGYRKRSYQPDDNNLYFLQNELKTPPGNYERLHYELNHMLPNRNAGQQQDEYVYAERNKRFPVAKRSSNFYGTTTASYHKRDRFNRDNDQHTQNRTLSASGTDPNVMKDLTNIFVSSHFKKVNITSKKINDKHSNKKTVVVTKMAPTRTLDLLKKSNQQIVATPNNNNQVQNRQDEPLKIKKKSVDWSNYFGIDRRKKKSDMYSDNNNKIDNDWLLKRYNKAVNQAMKRDYEFPLNIFRNRDQVAVDKQQPDTEMEKKSIQTRSSIDDLKIGDMDTKLENIEDHIIDEALKYTGAHEGDTDPKHVQQVKDKVISRLAAAYSLEKMRRALSEFRTSLAAQRYALKAKENQKKAPSESSVAMKNNPNPLLRIERRKCISKECDTPKSYSNQDKRIRNEDEVLRNLIEVDSGKDDMTCPMIDRRCQSVIAGEQTALFYSLCKWHQFCYLCSSKNNQVLLTNCDVMFLSKADLLCQGDVVCQWAARPAVDYLRDVHESAPMELGGHCDKRICEAEQPHTDTDQATIHR